MGRDKALLPWEGTTLLEHTLERLRAVCGEVRLLCGPSARYADYGVPLVLDPPGDAGPLGGVLAGLESLTHAAQVGLFLAVDVPRVPAALLAHLLEAAAGFDAVLPVGEPGAEPLCAVYGRACLEPIKRRLAAGERRMSCFWPDVRLRRVEGDELRRFGDPLALFANLNTPRDVA